MREIRRNCNPREDDPVFRTSRESFLTAPCPIPLATVLPLPACSTFDLYERLKTMNLRSVTESFPG